MSNFDQATLDFYAVEAPVYVASGNGGVSRHLPGFLERLTPGARILELGCGGGIDAAFMAAQGFAVEATDGTAEIALKAEERLGQPVRVMRFDELDAISRYDAVVASASLLHVPRDGLSGILSKIHCALVDKGWHIASYKGGGSEGRDRFGRYFNYYDAGELTEAYRAAGTWVQFSIQSGTGGGYDGKQGPWHVVTAQRN